MTSIGATSGHQTLVSLLTWHPPIPSDTSCLLYIDLVLPTVWVNYPYSFCSASKTVAYNVNAYLLDPTYPFTIYPLTAEAYHTSAAMQASPDQLQYIDV